ncbi:MAG TPA: hypothetical protein VEL11_04765 [Candidatus Bathyarchaeia archaeon]|nr:hypothetical protein [Candidatus Bathyarchaeia archaeon]
MICGALAPMNEAHAQSNTIHSQKQQQIGQSTSCRNNVTCTDIGLISFVATPNQEKNVTKLNLDEGQANLVQKDNTPFLLPFP